MHCLALRSHALPMQSDCYPDDLLPQLQCTLAALADVEVRYEIQREKLATTLTATGHREALLRRLDQKRDEECQPLHEKLVRLHERALNAAAARDLRLAG
jgi:hypothetical protein